MTERLYFCGDVWTPAGVPTWQPPWPNCVVNLEAPLTSGGKAAEGKICLASDSQSFQKTFTSPPLAACLANNHIMDFGQSGLEDTLVYLRSKGIQSFGAGTLQDGCNNPLLLDLNGVRVALMGYVCPSAHPVFAEETRSGVAPIDVSVITRDLQVARDAGAKRVVVSLHWGDEEVWLPRPEDVAIVRALLDLGVDLIVGHHAHCRQPIYVEQGRHVFFGLGNAVFPDFEFKKGGLMQAWKRQRWWNNTGLVVSYAPRSGEVDWKSFSQFGSRLSRLAMNALPATVWHALPSPQDPLYMSKYRSAKRYAYTRLAISRILARPRWPSIGSLLSVVRNVSRAR